MPIQLALQLAYRLAQRGAGRPDVAHGSNQLIGGRHLLASLAREQAETLALRQIAAMDTGAR